MDAENWETGTGSYLFPFKNRDFLLPAIMEILNYSGQKVLRFAFSF